MNILKKLMQRLCGCGKHDGREHVQSLTAQLRLGPADILESDENGIIPEQDRIITQVVILDADKKQIQCVVRPLQILRADGTWENIGGMKYPTASQNRSPAPFYHLHGRWLLAIRCFGPVVFGVPR